VSPDCVRSLLYAGLILSALVAAGCGNNASTQPTEKADKTVERFLDAWTRGEPLDKFADPNQPIQGSDPDWKAGYRLVSFLSADSKPSSEKPDHVRCRVALTLQDAKGKTWDKEVVYDVHLGEKNVITRAAP
jgi:hypothetical protein